MFEKGTSMENLMVCKSCTTTLETFRKDSFFRWAAPNADRTWRVLNNNGCNHKRGRNARNGSAQGPTTKSTCAHEQSRLIPPPRTVDMQATYSSYSWYSWYSFSPLLVPTNLPQNMTGLTKCNFSCLIDEKNKQKKTRNRAEASNRWSKSPASCTPHS